MKRHSEQRPSKDKSLTEILMPSCADDILTSLNTTKRPVKESEAQIQNIVENIKEVVFVTDAAGLWTYLNKSWTEVTGYSIEESLGTLFLNYVHPDDRDRNTELFTPLIERKKDYCRHEVRYLTKDGGYRWIEVFARLGLNEKEEVTGTYGTLLDITDRKKNEEAIQKATQEASNANLAKSEFLSRMSHELRTPLNSILGFGQLLEMGELEASHRKGVEHILKSGNYLLNLINEVLDITKIESGKLELSMEAVQIWGVVREMHESVEQQAQARNIRLITDYLDKDIYLRSDKQRIKQVILNLLNNAVKYNIDGGYIDVRSKRTQKDEFGKQLVRIQVSDNGIGISPDNLTNLFNPFERAGAQNSKTEGTGLGLAVVKKLVEAMGGKVGVESHLGEGSTFWFELPEESRIHFEENVMNAVFGLESDQNVYGSVLYVEDNLPNIELVEMILSTQRPEIRLNTVMNGKTAVSLATKCEADLILLDLNLPGMMGEEVLARLKSDVQTKDIPVVVVSADAMPQRVENILNAGAEDFLTKPLNMKAFLSVIDKYTLKTL